MKAHYAEHRAREQFGRKLEQLHFELSVGSPRRVLDYLIDHLDELLPLVGQNTLRDAFAVQLDRLKVVVARRHNLKLVKEGN